MGEWKNISKFQDKDLLSVGTMFESRKVNKMYDISELYPTKIIKLLGINSERYSVKLANPEKFTLSEILRLAFILSINPNLIIDVIQTEVEGKIISKVSIQRAKFS